MMTENAAELTLRLEQRVNASPERVFAAWTQPEILTRWSAPEGMTIGDGELDLRVGGRWRVVMLMPDGTPHEAFGTYHEISPPHRLVYSHAWRQGAGSSPETTVTVEFTAQDGATLVVLTQTGFGSEGSRDGHTEGWASTIRRLAALFDEEAA